MNGLTSFGFPLVLFAGFVAFALSGMPRELAAVAGWLQGVHPAAAAGAARAPHWSAFLMPRMVLLGPRRAGAELGRHPARAPITSGQPAAVAQPAGPMPLTADGWRLARHRSQPRSWKW